MSDTRLPGTNPTDVVPSATPASTRWTGWIAFAAFLMLMLGFFQAVKGLAAIINPDYFR